MDLSKFSLTGTIKKINELNKLRLRVTAGRGGSGFPVLKGIGGRGGDIRLVASERVPSLYAVRKVAQQLSHPILTLTSPHGQDAARFRLVGQAGSDTRLEVPVGITVFDTSPAKLMVGELNKPNEELIIANGGMGGSAETQWHGLRGDEGWYDLDHKMVADVGLVGFPNSGKSSLTKVLSIHKDDRVRIDKMPFTTIYPNLRRMRYPDCRQLTLVDTPGLLECAHRNFGIGNSFLKHIRCSRILVMVLDVNGFRWKDPWPERTAAETLLLLDRELEFYDSTLLHKPRVVLVNKMDTKTADDNLKRFSDDMQEVRECMYGPNGRSYSSKRISIGREALPSRLYPFLGVFPVNTKKEKSLEKFKHFIREIIDSQENERHDEQCGVQTFKQALDSEATSVSQRV